MRAAAHVRSDARAKPPRRRRNWSKQIPEAPDPVGPALFLYDDVRRQAAACDAERLCRRGGRSSKGLPRASAVWGRRRDRRTMATITATDVKKLRDQTGAGMMDCKAALEQAGGNFEEATTILRKRGLASAAKKAGRATSEGV